MGNQKYIIDTLLISDESLICSLFFSRQRIRLLLKWHDVTVLGLADDIKALGDILATLNNLFKIIQYWIGGISQYGKAFVTRFNYLS